jgi:acyl-CoA reductase-like NAD-dependent aldehyde dehydrogenase/cytochrome P450
MTWSPIAERPDALDYILALQRRAFVADGIPDAATRIDRLNRLAALIADHGDELTDAVTRDFGSRPRALTIAGDVVPCLAEVAEQKRHLEAWMSDSIPARVLQAAGLRASVRHDPLGVVGVMGPWNFPLQLTLVPAAAAIAAGNRVMVRPSSATPCTTDVLAAHAPDYLPIEEFAVITGKQGSGADFARLKLDSLFFTGSTATGAAVATAAAANLVPVTLELGGKNPAVVDVDADIVRSARRIAKSRITNSGQVCLCPDYVFVPADSVDAFVEAVLATWRKMFPTIVDNPDYTGTIDPVAYERILGLVADAERLGANKFEIVPSGETLPDARTCKIAPTVLTGVTDAMKIDGAEVFGPVLSVYPYRQIDEAIGHIGRHDHPLTVYWYGPRNRRFETLVARTQSGSVQGNDFLVNMLPIVPFGGVGASGMGRYHGKYGFDTFSHQRAVVHSSLPVSLAGLIGPPYGTIQRGISDAILTLARGTNHRAIVDRLTGMQNTQMCAVPENSGLKPVSGTGYPGVVDQIRFLLDRDKATRQSIERFGDLSYMNFFGRKMVMVMSPSAAETVVMNKDKVFANEPAWNFAIGVAFRRGILLMDFEEHRHHRLILQQAFAPTNLKGYLQEMQPVIAERVKAIPTGTVRLADEIKAITLEMALDVFVGVELSRSEADRINSAFAHCLEGLSALVRHPVPGGKWNRAIEGRKVLEEFFYRELPAKRETELPDLFSVLCHAESEDGHTFTDEDVVNHMIFLLFAAHDTSTTALTTMAYRMARHPEWQQRARRESLALDAELGYDTLAELTTIDLVMKESLRLNPPVPALMREALRDTELDGYFVPKGATVLVSPSAVHHNPRVWSDPRTFDPERFGSDRREDKIHRFAWMPFGGGVHKCIGLYFAQMEVKTIMHNLLREFEWTIADDYRWHNDPTTLGLPKDGLQATVRRR